MPGNRGAVWLFRWPQPIPYDVRQKLACHPAMEHSRRTNRASSTRSMTASVPGSIRSRRAKVTGFRPRCPNGWNHV